MHLTMKAVLARFNGNVGQAIRYCGDMGRQYPNLSNEYWSIAKMILAEKAEAAHA